MANASRRERLRAAQEHDQRRRRVRLMAVIGVVVGAAVAIAILVWSGLGSAAPQATNRPPNATTTNDGIAVNPGKAAAGAPRVNVYLDYQCSHCVSFEEKYGLALSTLATNGQIELVANTKVFLDKGNDSGLSHRAAMAAACADVSGVYSAYSQAVFASAYGGQYTDELFRVRLPQQTGITGDALTAFQTCYDSRAMLGWVNGVEEASSKAGVNATPTLTVNGKAVDLATLPDDVSRLPQFIADAAKG